MSAEDTAREKRRELRSYGVGFATAALLTAVPFLMVAWQLFEPATAYRIIGLCAIVQLVVHFRFFLHIGLGRSTRDDLQLILFTALIITLMVGGTIWVLGNLHTRMM